MRTSGAAHRPARAVPRRMSGLPFTLLVPEPPGSPGSTTRTGSPTWSRSAAPLASRRADDRRSATRPDPVPRCPGRSTPAIGLACCLGLLVRRRWPVGRHRRGDPADRGVGAVDGCGHRGALLTVGGRIAGPRVAPPARPAALCRGRAGLFPPARPGSRASRSGSTWSPAPGRASAAIGWGLFVQGHRRLTRSLRERAARLEAEQHLRVDQARLTERARIARRCTTCWPTGCRWSACTRGALEVRTDARPEEAAAAARDPHQRPRRPAGVAHRDRRPARGQAAGRPEPPQPGLAERCRSWSTALGRPAMTVTYTCRVSGVRPVGPSSAARSTGSCRRGSPTHASTPRCGRDGAARRHRGRGPAGPDHQRPRAG